MGSNGKKFFWQHIVKIVTERFITEGKDSTVADIAAAGGVSESTVRKVLAECDGCPKGLVCDDEYKASYSTNYTSFQTGTHKVKTYGPSRKALVEIIQYERTVKEALLKEVEGEKGESEAIIDAVGEVAKEA